MSLGKHRPPENDPANACSHRDSRRVHPRRGGAVSDSSQLETMHGVIGAQRQVESLKTALEEQVQSVLGIIRILFGS